MKIKRVRPGAYIARHAGCTFRIVKVAGGVGLDNDAAPTR